MQRLARIIGMAAALAVGTFILYFVGFFPPSSQPPTVVLGIAYIVAAAVVLLAPRNSAGIAASATAVVTGLFALVAAGNNIVDGLIMGAATLAEAWAARTLLKQPNPDRSPKPDDR